MEDIIIYMSEEKWSDDIKADRKRFLLTLAKNSSTSAEIARKIGSMLIYENITVLMYLNELMYSLRKLDYLKDGLHPNIMRR